MTAASLRHPETTSDALDAALELCEPWALAMPEDAEPVAFELDLSPWRSDEHENRAALIVSLVAAHFAEAPPGLDVPSTARVRLLESGTGRLSLVAFGFDAGPLEALCVYAVLDRMSSHIPGDDVRLSVYAAPINELERERSGATDADLDPALARLAALLRAPELARLAALVALVIDETQKREPRH